MLHPGSYNSNITREAKDEESEANVFASHFLMPERAMLRELNASRGLHRIDAILHTKHYFMVSYKTVLYRLVESKKAGEDIWKQFANGYKKKYRKNLGGSVEPNPVTTEFGDEPQAEQPECCSLGENRLYKLVRKAYEKEKITMSRASVILNLKLPEMRDLVNSWRDYTRL